MKLQLLTITLLITLISFSLPSEATSSEAVKDIDGYSLIPEQQYYILPVFRGRGGGLTMIQRNNTCPFYVAQEDLEVERGLPLVFRSVNPEDAEIHLETDLNIEFAERMTICVQSTVWQLDDKSFVVTGGISGNPGRETVNNWFKIEKRESGENFYKIVFCPSVCETCRVVCGDVGVVNEGGHRFLRLFSDGVVSFPVMFKRKDDEGFKSV